MRKTTSTYPLLLAAALVASAAVAEPAVVEIAAPDGVVLEATYTSPGKPGPGVLLLHACNSDRSSWTGLAHELAARGIHSLALDYRGFGESGGERGPEDRSKWADDVDAALALLISQPGVDGERIGAGGGSCGVDQAVQLARRHPGQIKTLVLLSGSTDGSGDVYLAENPWLPILASASLDDRGAVESTRWTLDFSGHPGNRFLQYDAGGHAAEMFAAHPELISATADWFDEHLATHPVIPAAAVTGRAGPSLALWNELMAPDGLERLTERMRAAREAGRKPTLPPEGALIAEGYRRIAAGESKAAVELLAFVVQAYPTSANALDTLGDAYLADGQPDKAAELARRTLDAIPGDPSLDANFAQILREAAEGKIAAVQPAAGQ